MQGSGHGTLHYELVREEGPDHNKHFVVAAYVDTEMLGTGEGSTKKAAEQQAAYQALLRLRGLNGGDACI